MIITNVNITIDAWIDALQKYTFEQMIFKNSPETWSVGQMSNHLLNDTDYYIEQIRICLKSNDHESDESSPEAKNMFKENEFPNIAIEGSPNNSFVKQPVSKEQLIRDFQNLKADLNDLSYMILKTPFRGKTKHPGLDYFSAIEWLQFADMHFRHHFRQKARLDEFLKTRH